MASGFSMNEIAAALLLKQETIKKRLSRARKTLIECNIKLDYPDPKDVNFRLSGVMHVIYLIFNEGFHSTKPGQLVNKDLCGEALRLCKLLLKKENFRSGSLYALFALMCFHSSRLESKISVDNEIVSLQNQDRSTWFRPLIDLGIEALSKSFSYADWSAYHYEAAIAKEHVTAVTFERTNWRKIKEFYLQLYEIQPTDITRLNIVTVCLQIEQFEECKTWLNSIEVNNLGQRGYLYYGCLGEYYSKIGDSFSAISHIDKAIELCSNEMEQSFLMAKRKVVLKS